MKRIRVVMAAAVLSMAFSAGAAPARAQGNAGLNLGRNEVPRLGALAKMPVKEVTVFKDGHAFVLHEGALATDGSGNVLMDYLPNPVLGTFWPYATGRNARLSTVVASERRVMVDRTALSIRDLMEANIGAEVSITEYSDPKQRYAATIVDVPQRGIDEQEASGVLFVSDTSGSFIYRNATPPRPGQPSPQKGSIVLLRGDDGVRVLPLDRIQDITFKTPPKTQLGNEEYRNLLTLRLDWQGTRPQRTADVGMMYLQRGIRWIPNYRVTLDGKGKATVKLQATLLNELTDLNDVTANLVIGVPTFAFKETPDPISLQDTLARLSPYFQENNARGGFALSNAMATQQARMGEYRVASENSETANLGPEVGDGGKTEDLYLFTVRHVSLKKGERMTLPVAEYSLSYKDVYALELPFAPPAELNSYYNTEQQREMARLFSAPKVVHKIRLTNSSTQPLTTAPALLMSEGRVLAQGMMTYASAGSNVDLDLTTAVDIRVTKTDTETVRTPNAVRWQNESYGRVDLNGKISLCNYRREAVELEVTRHVLGNVDAADSGGVITKVSVLEDAINNPARGYPEWWRHFNGVGRITWKVRLEPKKDVDLAYKWHYFWR
jgi:hypothetical protein